MVWSSEVSHSLLDVCIPFHRIDDVGVVEANSNRGGDGERGWGWVMEEVRGMKPPEWWDKWSGRGLPLMRMMIAAATATETSLTRIMNDKWGGACMVHIAQNVTAQGPWLSKLCTKTCVICMLL